MQVIINICICYYYQNTEGKLNVENDIKQDKQAGYH